jgi:hypothetical protein
VLIPIFEQELRQVPVVWTGSVIAHGKVRNCSTIAVAGDLVASRQWDDGNAAGYRAENPSNRGCSGSKNKWPTRPQAQGRIARRLSRHLLGSHVVICCPPDVARPGEAHGGA